MMQFHDRERVTGLLSKKQDQIQRPKPLQKRKRTKRQRMIVSSNTSSSCNSGDGGGENTGLCDLGLTYGGGGADLASFPANSDEFELEQSTIVDDVEEDMANCLILLAQGSRNESQSVLLNSKAISAADEFECKTCNRRFPSFQALGGHRASHTKPKSSSSSSQLEIKKGTPTPATENHQLDKFNNNTTSLSLQIASNNNNKLRIHECSICGAEFASGQALGGHMRRHRPLPPPGSRNSTTVIIEHESPVMVQAKKSRLEVLGLDLNLPAPEDDLRGESKFSFGSNDQVQKIAAASPLVGCHY